MLDHLVLPSPHKSLVAVIDGKGPAEPLEAIGIIETLTMCSLILAADAAAKCGEVRLHEIRLAMGLGGKAFVVHHGRGLERRGRRRARQRARGGARLPARRRS